MHHFFVPIIVFYLCRKRLTYRRRKNCVAEGGGFPRFLPRCRNTLMCSRAIKAVPPKHFSGPVRKAINGPKGNQRSEKVSAAFGLARSKGVPSSSFRYFIPQKSWSGLIFHFPFSHFLAFWMVTYLFILSGGLADPHFPFFHLSSTTYGPT